MGLIGSGHTGHLTDLIAKGSHIRIMMAQLVRYHHVPYLEAVAQGAGAPGVDD